MAKEEMSRHDMDAYCCVELLKAVCDGYLDERAGGIYLLNQNDSSCKSGVPGLDYCPFCGAKIKSKCGEHGWNWWTVKPLACPDVYTSSPDIRAKIMLECSKCKVKYGVLVQTVKVGDERWEGTIVRYCLHCLAKMLPKQNE